MNSTPFSKTTLPNGVRLLMIPMDGVNSVATSVMVGVGSRYENLSINGISHFLEHMVFKGTEKYPTTDDVNFIERLGGLQNAYTDIDITNYHNKVLYTDWLPALEINKELTLKPRLEEQYVDKERDVIIEEMKRYDDEPAAKVDEAFHKMFYEGTTLGMRVIGEEQSLRSSNAETLKTYHRTWYRPDKLVVVVAGRLDEEQEAKCKDQVTEWFGALEGKTEGTFTPVTNIQTVPRLDVITKPDANQAHMEMGLRTFARNSDERFAWSVFNLLMGVSFTSRLFREIREKRGLCYHIRSSSDNWADVGYWSIYAGVATDKVEEAVEGVMEELRKVKKEGISEEEVSVAKKRLETMIAFRSEDPEFQNEFYGRQEVFNEELMTLDEFHKKIERVTKEEIQSLIEKYFVSETLNLAVVWNKERDEKLLSHLAF